MVLSQEDRVTQLLSVLDDWTRAMMEGQNTDDVYFDFSKASIPCLTRVSYILKLRSYGIGGSFWSGYRVFFQIENRALSSTLYFLPDLLLVVFLKALYWAHYYLQYMLMAFS